MNTNMADGAAQRLVAEMGQILFGQPGLTLMELAEKVKDSQPSLQQKGDARAQFKAWWDSARPLEHRTFHFEIAWAAWQAALADLQPVGRDAVREALQAAARSLRTIADSTKGTEFLETASEIRAYAGSRANCAEQALGDSHPFGGEPNTAPNRLTETAQAVELETLQGVAAEYQKWIEFHSAGSGDYDDFLRSHILIDGQAVQP